MKHSSIYRLGLRRAALASGAAAIAFIAATLLALGPSRAADVSGVPHLVSGDTMTLGKLRIRLSGAAAPVMEQLCLDPSGAPFPCGVKARDELAARFGNKPWTCQAQRSDRYGRTVARCSVGGEDVGRWMVHSGWATVNLTQKDYDSDQAAAQAARAGLWAGAFIAPPEWRRRNASAPVLGALKVTPEMRKTLLRGRSNKPPSPDCAIKGHLNRSGTCIFHMPDSRWYAKVTMHPENGDRWFCSREEAEVANCRETKR